VNNGFSRATTFGMVILILGIVGASLVLLGSRPQPVQIEIHPPLPTATATITPTPSPLTIYITGAVVLPNALLTLQPDSRVEDAILAAGGALPAADLARVNLAALLRDGDQVHVPFVNEGNMVLPTTSGGERVYINTATAEELEALPGVGEALAAAIITHRDANGRFENFDDLDAVSGIGEGLISQWQELIVFD